MQKIFYCSLHLTSFFFLLIYSSDGFTNLVFTNLDLLKPKLPIVMSVIHLHTCLWPWIMLIPCKRFFSQPTFDEFFLSFDLLIRWIYKSCFHESRFIKTKVADCNDCHLLTCLWPWILLILCKRFFSQPPFDQIFLIRWFHKSCFTNPDLFSPNLLTPCFDLLKTDFGLTIYKKWQNHQFFLTKTPKSVTKKTITNTQFRIRENKIRETIRWADHFFLCFLKNDLPV